jgi:hypothetical protein
MKSTRIVTWRHVSNVPHLLILALAGVSWLGARDAAAQQPVPQPKPKEAPRQERETTVFRLRFVDARTLARTIKEALGGTNPGQDLRISVDERSNSVVVNGYPDDLNSVRRLIAAMDVAPGKSEPEVRVFQLRHTRADGYLQQALSLIASKATVDPQRNVVIVSGDAKTLEAAATLLQRLDTPQARQSAPDSMQVRVVWLASGLTRKEGPKLPDDMKEIVAELAKMGIEEPRLITQASVSALPETEFRVEGLAGLDSPPYRLSVSGRLFGRPEETRLHISIIANQVAAPPAPPAVINQIGRLDTEIAAPLGHSVVLGMTPTATSTSVFVVQILPRR